MLAEQFKGGVHFMVGGFAATLSLYNAMRYIETQERHSLVNLCAYTLLFGLEWRNCRHHWSKPR